MNQKNDLHQNIRSAICKSLFFSCAGLLFIFASLYIDINLPNSNTNYWFQRGGSVAVLLSALAEYQLLKVNPDINYAKSAFAAETEYKERYGGIFDFALYLATGTFAVGTLIWGYGDIPFIGTCK